MDHYTFPTYLYNTNAPAQAGFCSTKDEFIWDEVFDFIDRCHYESIEDFFGKDDRVCRADFSLVG